MSVEMTTDENVSPIPSPPLKKERRVMSPPQSPSVNHMRSLDGETTESPPRLSPRFERIKEVMCYDKPTVDELFGLLVRLLDKSENEALYWSTLYEESQKELFGLREKVKKDQKEEAEYIDPEVIPQAPRRNSKQPLEEGLSNLSGTPSGNSSRWGLFRGVLNAVARTQYATGDQEES